MTDGAVGSMDVLAMAKWLYQEDLPVDGSLEPVRELLEGYSGIEPTAVEEHLLEIVRITTWVPFW